MKKLLAATLLAMLLVAFPNCKGDTPNVPDNKKETPEKKKETPETPKEPTKKPEEDKTPKLDYTTLIGTWKPVEPAEGSPEEKHRSLLSNMIFLFHADKKAEFGLRGKYYEGTIAENSNKKAFIFSLESPKYDAVITPVANNPKLYNMELTGKHFSGSIKMQITKTNDKPERPVAEEEKKEDNTTGTTTEDNTETTNPTNGENNPPKEPTTGDNTEGKTPEAPKGNTNEETNPGTEENGKTPTAPAPSTGGENETVTPTTPEPSTPTPTPTTPPNEEKEPEKTPEEQPNNNSEEKKSELYNKIMGIWGPEVDDTENLTPSAPGGITRTSFQFNPDRSVYITLKGQRGQIQAACEPIPSENALQITSNDKQYSVKLVLSEENGKQHLKGALMKGSEKQSDLDLISKVSAPFPGSGAGPVPGSGPGGSVAPGPGSNGPGSSTGPGAPTGPTSPGGSNGPDGPSPTAPGTSPSGPGAGPVSPGGPSYPGGPGWPEGNTGMAPDLPGGGPGANQPASLMGNWTARNEQGLTLLLAPGKTAYLTIPNKTPGPGSPRKEGSYSENNGTVTITIGDSVMTFNLSDDRSTLVGRVTLPGESEARDITFEKQK